MPRAVSLGAIDAGSNALRVVVAALSPEGVLTQLEAERVAVRLGHGAFTKGELDAATIDAAVAAFRHFRILFDKHGVQRYRAVATSAVRSADNRDALVHRLYHEAGIELEVIDGDEEARLVRKAVIHAFGGEPVRAPGGARAGGAPRCVLDLGGGSLEINVRNGPTGTTWRGYSLPIGTVRLIETFGFAGAIGDAEAGMVRRYAATLLDSVLRDTTEGRRRMSALDLSVAASCGGNAEALARILGESTADGRPCFELASLERALPELLGADVETRMTRYGVRRDRAEVMGVAALVLATTARQLGIQRIIAPGVGIREAALLELAEAAAEEQARAEGAVDKALLTAARSFANRVEHDTTHGEHVRVLARSLFQQTRDLHQLPEELAVVLEVAALLHDVGEVVNTRGHHKHSEYMIRWGRIPGLEGAQRELVALLARCHRKPSSDARKVIAESTLTKDQRGPARKLAALLRLADGFDSGHRERVERVVVSRSGDTVVLDVATRDGPGKDDAELRRKADMFEEELGVKVQLTVGRSIPAAAASGEPGRGLAVPRA